MAETWHGRFAWHELMTTDPAAAEAFYTKVVGWRAERFPGLEEPYTTWMAGAQPVGGLMALPEEAKAGGAPPHSGSPTSPSRAPTRPWPMPRGSARGSRRARAQILDPQGAAFALHQATG